MSLLVDIGNSRIKWAVLGEQGLGAQQADIYSQWGGVQVRTRILDPVLVSQPVYIANVGGVAIGELLAATIRDTWGVEPQFVRTTAAAAGVRNGYAQPEKLGVDRWLAVIGAFREAQRATCVVSVGTAMTVDGVARDGRHIGGIIVPGPDLMIASLMMNTSDIAAHARDGHHGSSLFAENTLAAVYQGAVHALAAVVERAMQDMQTLQHETPLLVLTGGASDKVEQALRIPYRVVPDLVLRGLAVRAQELQSA
ncbi:MAG: type III pantothenate kinase [Candidatus Obscuribacterales bacterium]|nr:type III pantothenate kinase [Steroidobacteraceae bacterium]